MIELAEPIFNVANPSVILAVNICCDGVFNVRPFVALIYTPLCPKSGLPPVMTPCDAPLVFATP